MRDYRQDPLGVADLLLQHRGDTRGRGRTNCRIASRLGPVRLDPTPGPSLGFDDAGFPHLCIDGGIFELLAATIAVPGIVQRCGNLRRGGAALIVASEREPSARYRPTPVSTRNRHVPSYSRRVPRPMANSRAAPVRAGLLRSERRADRAQIARERCLAAG